MFTGLIEKTGTLESIDRAGEGYVINISITPWDTPIVRGESIAVNGACLSVTEFTDTSFSCDVLDETIDKTNLKARGAGSPVNLERALPANGRFGGHMVAGHVDGIGILNDISNRGRDKVLRVSCSRDISSEIVKKGSIALDGVSLTVTDVSEDSFEVNIIPVTWQNTNLNTLSPGAEINLETDIIGKYVRKALMGADPDKSDITEENLRNAGFM